MSQEPPEELPNDSAAMASVLFAESSLGEIMDIAVRLGKATLQSADAVSVTLIREGRPRTQAFSDDVAYRLDQVQYANDEGPCLDALTTHTQYLSRDLQSEQRWPTFSEAAADAGINSILSLPLAAGTQSVGSFNVYSKDHAGFNKADLSVATLFAEQASVVLANAQSYYDAVSRNQNLWRALENRGVIGEAKGILMERESVDSEEAFAMLRHLSQVSNTKLHEVARKIVSSTSRSAGGDA